jgi:nickel transport protein
MRASLVALVLLAAPAAAAAHDLWLERDGDGFALRYGDRGGEVLGLDAAKVKSVRCVDGGSSRDLRAGAAAGPKELRVGGRCEVVSAFLDGGFWTLTPDGEQNLPKTQVPGAVRSWASRQFAKWVDAHAPSARQPVGDELEIVPASDLARLREGDKATFRVLSHGAPVTGAAVAVGHKVIGETDRAGEVRLRLRSRGLETISASVRRPLSSPQADALVLEASLSFEVAR